MIHRRPTTGPDQRVIRLQHRLAAWGFDPGVRHGFMDFATRGAINQFQNAAGLPVTPGGLPDDPTVFALVSPAPNDVPTPGVPNAALSWLPPPSSGPAPDDDTPDDEDSYQPRRNFMSDMSMHKSPGQWSPTGLRVPLVLAQSIPAATSALVSQNPQMDFRGENFVIDTVIVGPNCTVTVPTVGTTPQVAGGPASTGVPGTIFSPNQNVPLDFSMMISNQGNAVSVTVTNTLTSLALAFAALLFGHEVSAHQARSEERNDTHIMRQGEHRFGGRFGGMAPAGSFGGMAPAGSFGGAAYGGRGGGYYQGR